MRFIRYVLLLIVLLVAVTVALANYGLVTLHAWPETITTFVGFELTVTLPVFVVVGGAAGLGLFVGLIWEWLRERNYRAEAAQLRREVATLRAAGESARKGSGAASSVPVRATRSDKGDDVLDILEEAPARQ